MSTKVINFEYTRCQEVIGESPIQGNLIECGKQGAVLLFHSHDGRNVYVMCEACGYHNIKNRGGIELVAKETES